MKTVIEMAQLVGATRYTNRHYPDRPTYTFSVDRLKRFSELVRADEREACAKVCDDYDYEYDAHTKQTKQGITAAIRARGNT